MKRILGIKRKLILTILICLLLLLILNSCELLHKLEKCKPGEWETQTEPTCSSEGLRVKKCIKCGEILESEAIAMLEHNFGYPKYGNYDDGSGCSEWIYSKSCQDCGFVEIIKRGKNHDYRNITTYSTCTTYGYDTLTCKNCGDVQIREHTTLANHVYNEEYLSDGNHHWHKCKNCENLSEKVEHAEDESGLCTFCGTRVAYTDGIIYELSDDRSYAIVTGYEGSNERVRIMPEYEGVPVTHIGKAAFKYNSDLFSVSLTDSITHIESEAFSDCPYLKHVWHIDNAKYIGDDAFKRNFILELSSLPTNLEYIGNNAFSECGNITISVIPDSVTYMGSEAFYHCNRIKSVKIGNSLTEIKSGTFRSCYNLGAVVFGENLITIGNKAFQECYYIEALEFPDSLVSIGEDSFTHCNRLTSVYLGKSFKTIGNRSFNGCYSLDNIHSHEENEHFTSVDGVVYTKDLFTLICYPSGRKSEELIIPEGVKVILDYAFYGMGYIKNLILPTTLTDIGVGAFRECPVIESVTILGETKIGDYAFWGCGKLANLQLSNGVTTIGESAFSDCGFIELVIPDSVTSMGRAAFSSCYYLEKLTIGSGLKDIPECAFLYCGSYLNTVIISEGVETIGEQAFANCYALNFVSIPDSVKSIGANAFNGCNRLTKIVVGEGLSKVGEGAFAGNTEIDYIFYKGNENTWKNIAFEGKNMEFKYEHRRYYYSEAKPSDEGNYWHYNESGKPIIWLYQNPL